MFQFFLPAPYVDEIEDKEQVKKLYRYWRIRIFYSIYVGYVGYYLTRKSFTFIMPTLADDLNLDMASLGFLGSLLYMTYGFSKFFGGVLSDKANPRYFMATGLILTGIANICFGLSSSIFLFALFWAFNGLFQGFGWPPCTKQLTYWFAQEERGFFWSLKSSSHNVGGALIPLLCAYLATQYDWRVAMYVPGVICIFLGFLLINRLRDVPQTLGLPPIEKFKGSEDTSTLNSKAKLSVREILETVLTNKAVWLLSFSYFCIYVVRSGINDWGAMFMVKAHNYSLLEASVTVTWFEVGGFVGTILAGILSDKLFQGRRVPLMLYCCLFVSIVLCTFWSFAAANFYLDCGFMFLIGGLIFGPQLLVGLAAAEIVDKQAACTANGFAGWFAYIGAACTGYPLGKVIDIWHWEGFFWVMICCSLLTIVILVPLTLKKSENQLEKKPALT